jgi:hypothetical protein
VLGNVSDGAAVFSAEAQPLDHPQSEQHKRRRHPDRLVRRDQPDRPRAEAHAGQGDQERVLAADLIAEPPKQERPERADQKSGGEQRNRAQQRRDRVRFFEELDRQDGGQAAEDVEVKPLDDISRRRGDDDRAEILRNFRNRRLLRGGRTARCCAHVPAPVSMASISY